MNSINIEAILNTIKIFIEDDRPTEINTDWERGCAYALDEIEKIIKREFYHQKIEERKRKYGEKCF